MSTSPPVSSVLSARHRDLRDHRGDPAWPLIFKAIRKVLPAKAAAVVDEISEEPALAVAEHHHVEVTTQTDEGPSRTEDKETPK